MVDNNYSDNDEDSSKLMKDSNGNFDDQTFKISLPNGTPIENAQYIVNQISEIDAYDNLAIILHYLKKLEEIVKSNSNDDEIFYCLIEGITISLQSQEDDGDSTALKPLVDKIISLMEINVKNFDYLAALSDTFLLAERIIISNDLLDDLEKYTHFIVNFSLKHSNNIILRTTAADAVILTLTGFGNDWNYEKTKQYGGLLRGLLPPQETTGIFASILIKGLSEEISCYGDMHELGALERSLVLLKEVYQSNIRHKLEIIEDYTTGLINALRWFGEAENYEKMMELLKEVAHLAEENPKLLQIKIAYAKGLRIALDLSGVMENLETATKLAKDLLNLAEEFPENKEIQTLALIGLFKAAVWAGAFWETGLIVSLLSGVIKIYKRFPNDNHFKIQLGRGLFNLTKELTQIGKKKVMEKIIEEIRTLHEDNPDLIEVMQYYAKSLVNAIYLFGEISESREEVLEYLEQSAILAKLYSDDEEAIVNYSKSLVNVIRILGKFGEIDEMEKTMDILRDFSIATDSREVLIRLAKAYIDAISAYGEMNELEKIIPLYNELINWAEDDTTDIDFQILLTKAIVNIISSFGKNNRFPEMETYLEDMREIVDEYPGLSDIQIQLVKGLSLAIHWYLKENHSEPAMKLYAEIDPLKKQFVDELIISEIYARTSRRILVHASQQGNESIIDSMLDILRNLLAEYPESETIQIELARGLSHLIIIKSGFIENSDWQSIVMEMKGLQIQFPYNETLEGIYKTVEPLFRD